MRRGLERGTIQIRQTEIFNTDQGSQFTSFDFTGVLKAAEITISMDGRGRCMDNIFIERLWRSLKYEAIYLHELTDGFKTERVIGEWIGFYNTERPHSALGDQTPAEAYGAVQPMDMMDKAPALPTSPQAQQTATECDKQDSGSMISIRNTLNLAAKLSNKVGPPHGDLEIFYEDQVLELSDRLENEILSTEANRFLIFALRY